MDYSVWETPEFTSKTRPKEVITGCVGYFIKVVAKAF